MTKSPAFHAFVAAAACFFSLTVDAQQGIDESISLRGFTPGGALTACPKGYKRTTLLPGKQNFVCGQLNASIGGAQAQMFSIDVFAGKIVRLGAYKIASDGLNGLSEALALKFGTPKVSNKTKSTLTAEWNRGVLPCNLTSGQGIRRWWRSTILATTSTRPCLMPRDGRRTSRTCDGKRAIRLRVFGRAAPLLARHPPLPMTHGGNGVCRMP